MIVFFVDVDVTLIYVFALAVPGTLTMPCATHVHCADVQNPVLWIKSRDMSLNDCFFNIALFCINGLAVPYL